MVLLRCFPLTDGRASVHGTTYRRRFGLRPTDDGDRSSPGRTTLPPPPTPPQPPPPPSAGRHGTRARVRTSVPRRGDTTVFRVTVVTAIARAPELPYAENTDERPRPPNAAGAWRNSRADASSFPPPSPPPQIKTHFFFSPCRPISRVLLSPIE